MRLLITGVLLVCAVRAGDLDRARQLYEHTEYQGAFEILNHSNEAKSGPWWELAGKAAYQMGDFKLAISAFEKAIKAEPNNSRYNNWLGRAWGRRAETSNPFSAPGYASKARQYFERAVELNPKDKEAVNDLFTYYLDAPGFLGGGIDRAAGLTEQIRSNDPAEYHLALAQIAERRKQYDLAEGQLHRAIDLAPKQAGRMVDLAKFLARRGKYAESENAFTLAAKVDPNSKQVLFARAETYIESGRKLDDARELLRQYLQSTLSPDDPPRGEALRLLKRVSGE